MSYIDRHFLYLTRAYLIKKAKYHEAKHDELKDTKDIDLGNGLFQSDEHLASQFEYLMTCRKVCEVVTRMQRIDNFRSGISSQLNK